MLHFTSLHCSHLSQSDRPLNAATVLGRRRKGGDQGHRRLWKDDEEGGQEGSGRGREGGPADRPPDEGERRQRRRRNPSLPLPFFFSRKSPSPPPLQSHQSSRRSNRDAIQGLLPWAFAALLGCPHCHLTDKARSGLRLCGKCGCSLYDYNLK